MSKIAIYRDLGGNRGGCGTIPQPTWSLSGGCDVAPWAKKKPNIYLINRKEGNQKKKPTLSHLSDKYQLKSRKIKLILFSLLLRDTENLPFSLFTGTNKKKTRKIIFFTVRESWSIFRASVRKIKEITHLAAVNQNCQNFFYQAT